MKQALGINADSLSRSLEELMAAGWVARNSGYGHPLRPEYVLTAAGRELADHCSTFQGLVGELDVVSVVYRKWSVPTLIAIEQGATRFNELRDELAITPRALSQSLDNLFAVKLVRQHDGYGNTVRGTRIASAALSLSGPGL